jgi:hypothetical protein
MLDAIELINRWTNFRSLIEKQQNGRVGRVATTMEKETSLMEVRQPFHFSKELLNVHF